MADSWQTLIASIQRNLADPLQAIRLLSSCPIPESQISPLILATLDYGVQPSSFPFCLKSFSFFSSLFDALVKAIGDELKVAKSLGLLMSKCITTSSKRMDPTSIYRLGIMTCGFLRVYHRKMELLKDLTALPQLLNLLIAFLMDLEPHKKLKYALKKHIEHTMEGRYLDVSKKEQIKTPADDVFKFYSQFVVKMLEHSPNGFLLLELFAKQTISVELDKNRVSATLRSFKDPIFAHYMIHVLQAKNTVSETVMTAAHTVLNHVGVEKDFEPIFAALEKSLLRSTENALVIILSILKHTQVSLSSFLPKLLPNLWNGLKSTNVNVVQLSSFCFNFLSKRLLSSEDQNLLINSAATALSNRSLTVEQRIAVYNSLVATRVDFLSLEALFQNYWKILTSEKNDAVFSAGFSLLIQFRAYFVDQPAFYSKFMEEGLGAKSIARRAMFCRLLSAINIPLNNASEKQILSILGAIDKANLTLLDEKNTVGSYVEGIFCLHWWIKNADQSQVLAFLSSDKSFLFNEKLYMKLCVEETVLTCLSDIVVHLLKEGSSDLTSLVAFLALSCSSSTAQYYFREQLAMNICQYFDRVSATVLNVLLVYLPKSRSVELLNINNSQAYGQRLFRLVNVLVTNELSLDQKHSVLKQLLVIVCDSSISGLYGSDEWIRLCYKTGLEPKQVISVILPQLISSWTQSLEDSKLGSFYPDHPRSAATFNALKLIATIDSFEVVRVIMNYVSKEMDRYESLSTNDIEAAHQFTSDISVKPQKSVKGKSKDTKDPAKVAQLKEIHTQVTKTYESLSVALHSYHVLCETAQKSILQFSDDRLYKKLGFFVHQTLERLTALIKKESAFKFSPSLKKQLIHEYVTTCSLFFSLFDGHYIRLPLTLLFAQKAISEEDFWWKKSEFDSIVDSALDELDEANDFHSIWNIALTKCLLDNEIDFSSTPRMKYLTKAADHLFANVSNVVSPCIDVSMYVNCIIRLMENYPKFASAGTSALISACVALGDREEAEYPEALTNGMKTIGGMKAVLSGLFSPNEDVRANCAVGLSGFSVPEELKGDMKLAVFVTCHDTNEDVKRTSESLWADIFQSSQIGKESITQLLCLLVKCYPPVTDMIALSLSDILAKNQSIQATLEAMNTLFDNYSEYAAPAIPEYDDYGMVIPESLKKADSTIQCSAIADTLHLLIQLPTNDTSVTQFYKFMINGEALGDARDVVRRKMLSAAISAVESHVSTQSKLMLSIFDGYLNQAPIPSEVHDRIRENVVILLGTLARHMSDHGLVPRMTDKLIDTLKTPSEQVQLSVTECIASLVSLQMNRVEELLSKLFQSLFTSQSYAERRGAAYGIAGIVKGVNISGIKRFDIMIKIKEAAEDRKDARRREAAMFLIETLSSILGRLFEPFVVRILPLLLSAFGDSSREVRLAAEDASKAIMLGLSAHCVKLILPSLIERLEDDSWRTKTAAIDVLGSMAFLAPKQLSTSLPKIVPSLCEVLVDSHSKVQTAGKEALSNLGKVIKNPEISALVPTILDALVDPNDKTNSALVRLLETSFVHYIDAASLALIIPIVRRGLRERATDVKKNGAQILGNMASLTEQTDLLPYLGTVLPHLREVLMDPIPLVRATSAKAFGSIFKKLGERNLPGLLDELFDILKGTDVSGVDRAGAAQGISEILAALTVLKLEALLPGILLSLNSTSNHVREGYMTLLIYLPATYEDDFSPYLSNFIAPILRGLADEYEPVRESAFKTGQTIINNYAHKSVDLLLPELEAGLFDKNWRIRHSSIKLLGDWLHKVGGVSHNVDLDENEDSGINNDSHKHAIVAVIGQHRYFDILSRIYIARADAHASVRQAAFHVWKSLVGQTPRTLREIFHVLAQILIDCLASESNERRGAAVRTISDLVRKLTESNLREVLPMFKDGLTAPDAHVREGICIGIAEIISSAGKDYLQDLIREFAPFIKQSLLDKNLLVREAAAKAFDFLYISIGPEAIEIMVPDLITQLQASDESALLALKQLLTVRGAAVFPLLTNALLAPPLTAQNTRALCLLIEGSGSSLGKRLDSLLSALLVGILNGEAVEGCFDALKSLFKSVEAEDVLHRLMDFIMTYLKDESLVKRELACQCIAIFAEQSSVHLDPYALEMYSLLVPNFMIKKGITPEMMKSSWSALNGVSKRIEKSTMEAIADPVKIIMDQICFSLDSTALLDAFCFPKGISPLLPIFLQGLMNGSMDLKERSAEAIGTLVLRSPPEHLKPFVPQIIGPLIRISGDRIADEVKHEILKATSILFDKVPLLIKPFLPQLQRTYLKAIVGTDNEKLVQMGRDCLIKLVPHQIRLEPLILELCQYLMDDQQDNVTRVASCEVLSAIFVQLSQQNKTVNEQATEMLQKTFGDALEMDSELSSHVALCVKKLNAWKRV